MTSLSPATRALWSLRAAKTSITGASALTSTRLLHLSRSTFNEDNNNNKSESDVVKVETASASDESASVSAETAEGTQAPIPTKLPHRRKRFHLWLQTEGRRYAIPSSHGPNYVSNVPFPMNYLFRPTPPISNFAKEEIYRMHMKDTTRWTPRQLGMEYNISIKRVEAILRLKHLEKEMMIEGFVPQDNFTAGMEQLMGVRSKRSLSIVEPLTDILPNVGRPRFETVDEDKQFTAEDAAKVLERRPLAEYKALQLEEERKRPFKLVDSIKGVAKQEPSETKSISRNTAEANPRFKFTI
ncbi:hypothetical protein BGZ65_002030, partial [Modicella reniformis]